METGEPGVRGRPCTVDRESKHSETATPSKGKVMNAWPEGLEVHQGGHVWPCRGAAVGEEEGGVRRRQGGKCLFQNAKDRDGAEGVEWTF